MTPAVGKSPEALEVGGPKPGRERINGNFRILKRRYDSTLEKAIFSGDFPLTQALNRLDIWWVPPVQVPEMATETTWDKS